MFFDVFTIYKIELNKSIDPRRNNRSGGTRGADVFTLRGSKGADFEADVVVTRGKRGHGLFATLTCNKTKHIKHILIKGTNIFVFSRGKIASPEYSIPLNNQIVQVDINNDVILVNQLGDIDFRFKFYEDEDKVYSTKFIRVLKTQINLGNCEELKKVCSIITYLHYLFITSILSYKLLSTSISNSKFRGLVIVLVIVKVSHMRTSLVIRKRMTNLHRLRRWKGLQTHLLQFESKLELYCLWVVCKTCKHCESRSM